jgi:hypothetical protein
VDFDHTGTQIIINAYRSGHISLFLTFPIFPAPSLQSFTHISHHNFLKLRLANSMANWLFQLRCCAFTNHPPKNMSIEVFLLSLAVLGSGHFGTVCLL